MKFVSIIGTRPQIIKLLPIQREFKNRNLEHVVINTGQHYTRELSADLFSDLEIPEPKHNLNIFKFFDQSHTSQTAQMMLSIHRALELEKPDKVLIYGDTNSTLAASLVCAKEGLYFAHVEAGVRSFDQSMPEEINRVIADNLATVNFTPTLTAQNNLKNEGLSKNSLFVGDVMLDTFLILKPKIENLTSLIKIVDLPAKYFVLTLHRPSNVDLASRLNYILEKINNIGAKVVFPAHPRTLKNLSSRITSYKNLLVINPLTYLNFAYLLHGATGLLTDSGGLQKEAFFQGVPTYIIRESTEWPETLLDGKNQLSFNLSSLNNFAEQCSTGKSIPDYKSFGLGNAGAKIVDFLSNL